MAQIATWATTLMTKAGGVFTGGIGVRSDSGGYIELQPGDATRAGFANFYSPAAVRIAYIGFGTETAPLSYVSSNGAGHSFTGGPLLFPNGTVSAPGLALGLEPGTGLYRVGASILGFTVGGRQQFELTSNGAAAIYADTANGNAVDMVGRPSDSQSKIRYLSADRFATRASTGPNGTGIYETISPAGTSTASGAGTAHFWSIGGVGTWQITNSYAGPVFDNVIACGGASARYTVVYAQSGTISTSDLNDKDWRGPLEDREKSAALEIIKTVGVFKFKDGERLHIGVGAQTVWSIMAKHGLVDPIDDNGRPGTTPYAFLCFDEWEEDGITRSRYGIRYDELNIFLIASAIDGIVVV